MSGHGSSGPDLGRPWQDPAHYRAWPDASTREAQVFSGLSPRDRSIPDEPSCSQTPTSGLVKNSFFTGLPILMTGTLAAGVAATGSFPTPDVQATPAAKASESVSAQALIKDVAQRLQHAVHPVSHAVLGAIAPHIPDTYTVKDTDTVDSIAEAFGLPVAAVLGMNGLHINSVLHEGQVLKLTTAPTKQRAQAPPRVGLSQYVIQSGDTLATIALRLGISENALAKANGIEPRQELQAGDILRIPGTRQVTAPRAIPAIQAAQGHARVVWANSESDSSQSATTASRAQLASLPANEAPTDQSDDSAESPSVDPLSVDIPDAPKLRVVKPPPPPPPPPPPTVTAEPKKSTPATPAPAPPPASSASSSTNEASAPAPAPREPVTGNVVQLRTDSQREHARTVIRVGRDLGVSDYGIVIALATAMQESSFRNITTAIDHDSLGLFQQRPAWWGTPEQLTDPVYATTAFFKGARGTNGGWSRGLLGISDWESLPLTVAAQRVQRSAHPELYGNWEASAWAWLEQLG